MLDSKDSFEESSVEIPAEFGEEFLNWFRARIEAAWSAHQPRLGDYADFYGADYQGWTGGLSEEQINQIEQRWSLRFPPDYRLFLRVLHAFDHPLLEAVFTDDGRPTYPTPWKHSSFCNWLDDEDVWERFDRLETVLQLLTKDDRHWPPSWGERPSVLSARRKVRALVAAARMIPIRGHRYLLAEPCRSGNPVFSIQEGGDIIEYGPDLRTYLLHEFAELLGIDRERLREELFATRQAREEAYDTIPFWGKIYRALDSKDSFEEHGVEIPAEFGEEFLNWFRARTEAAWSAYQPMKLEDYASNYGADYQRGTRWVGGLSEEQIDQIERRWSLRFPPDYRLFLRVLHAFDRPLLAADYDDDGRPTHLTPWKHSSFCNWLDDDDVRERFDWLVEGLQPLAEDDHHWHLSWGVRPSTLSAQKERVRELVAAAPRMIPVLAHRYLLAEPCQSGNPVFSIWGGGDIIDYGPDLRTYLLHEFSELLGLDMERLREGFSATQQARDKAYEAIPFWGEIYRANNSREPRKNA